MNYQDVNAGIIDGWCRNGWEWGIPVSHEVYAAAENGEWNVLLTPTRPVPHEWIGSVKGKQILGLACGGGQQMPVFAALQAKVTVLDYSKAQLETERMVAAREKYPIDIVYGDMTKTLPFSDSFFDLIFFPVANCYAENMLPIWKECSRVLKTSGVLLAGMDNGFCFAFDETETKLEYTLPFNPLKNELHRKALAESGGGYQFSHSIDDLIGGQLSAGFQLTGIYGDTGGSGNLHEHGIQTFWATRAVKV